MQNVFSIVGKDEILIEEAIKDILKEFKDDNYEIIKRSIEDVSLDFILGELNTPSLFTKNAIVITDANMLLSNKVSDKYFDFFKQYLNNPAPFNILILIFTEESDLSRFEFIKKSSIFIKIEDNIDSSDFIVKYLKKANFTIENDALEYLASYGDDLLLIKNRLDSLMCLKYEDQKIDLADIKSIISPPLENNIYKLVEHVMARNPKKAYEAYLDFKKEGIFTNFLLNTIINKFIDVYNVYTLVKAGYKQVDIQEVYKVKPGRAYYMLQDLKNYDFYLVKDNLIKLYDIDYKYKAGLVDLDQAFSLYLLSL